MSKLVATGGKRLDWRKKAPRIFVTSMEAVARTPGTRSYHHDVELPQSSVDPTLDMRIAVGHLKQVATIRPNPFPQRERQHIRRN